MYEYYINREYHKVHAEGAPSADHPTNPEKRIPLGRHSSMPIAVRQAEKYDGQSEAYQLCDGRM